MKQKREGKFVFEGKFPLIRFGIFAEDSDQSDSDNQSNPIETEDVVISTSEVEIEEVHVSPIAIVPDEHDHLYNVEVETQSIHEEGDEDLNEDVDFLKEIDFTRISDDIPTNIELDLDDDELGPLPGFNNSCFRKVNEVATLATKTGEDSIVLKIFLSSSKPLEVYSGQRDSSLERSQSNTSLGVPTVSHEPQVLSTVTTAIVFTPPLQSDEGPSTMFEIGGSSSVPEYSPTQPSLDEASIRLAKHLAQNSPTSSSRGKGISFREEHSGDDKSTMSELREEIGDKVKALFQQPHGIEDPPMDTTQYTHGEPPVDPSPPRTTTIVD
ncbi:unnamed protein product [Lactuca saligna]|uniref:Uncharacterized protein n=1 Tax=Lactuca saligna TaxID=75948 RepID=A0AA35ZWL9_LACSI|nr:unnamed protein product [Lactuca saligna]